MNMNMINTKVVSTSPVFNKSLGFLLFSKCNNNIFVHLSNYDNSYMNSFISENWNKISNIKDMANDIKQDLFQHNIIALNVYAVYKDKNYLLKLTKLLELNGIIINEYIWEDDLSNGN